MRFPIAEPYAGGLEAHTHQLALGLRELGHDVTLVADPASDASFRILPVSVDARTSTVGLITAYRKALRRLQEGDFQVVQNNSIHFLPPLLAGRLGCPVFTTLHTPPYKLHRLSGSFTKAKPRHHYLAISHFISEQWEAYVGASTVIHNGVSLANFTFNPAVHRPIPSSKKAIWYGRITPEKGTYHALEAARLAGFSLQFAGPIEDEKYFQQQIKPRCGKEIRYLGALSQQKLAQLVGSADVGVITPIWDEPFGLVAIEMLACGTPVAAFSSGAIGEILNTDCGVTVPKGNSALLAKALVEAADKDRNKCRERAKAFSLRQMVNSYEMAYQRAVSISGPPRS